MELQEAGKVAGTHGIHGEIKVEPWCDGPDFLLGFDEVYISSKPFKVLSARVHKSLVLMRLEGLDNPEDAGAYRGKTLYINREGVVLPPGRYFISDLIGLSVIDGDGERVGTLYDVLSMPAHDVYHVRGEGDHYIPAVPEFVKEIDIDKGIMHVNLIEGM